ncbi:hypothetical protein QYE76_040351 [Lolium multiflorum]|uniref:Uncharacterized protein n=1 Tax=Lolium multiflorum TaxID=4521 RepID=A0AAD8WVD0_LOLMU|nr:hypothetical protein QYE76_040351 [Lolium multiflorum]
MRTAKSPRTAKALCRTAKNGARQSVGIRYLVGAPEPQTHRPRPSLHPRRAASPASTPPLPPATAAPPRPLPPATHTATPPPPLPPATDTTAPPQPLPPATHAAIPPSPLLLPRPPPPPPLLLLPSPTAAAAPLPHRHRGRARELGPAAAPAACSDSGGIREVLHPAASTRRPADPKRRPTAHSANLPISAARRCFEVDTGAGVVGVLEEHCRRVIGLLRRLSVTLRGSHVEVETPQDAETSEDPEENTKEYYEALFASQKPLHENTERQTTVAKNILRYLPVLPRIQRLFMTEDTAQQMRWAVEGNRYTDKMIHPSDGTAWKNFVKKFPLKAGDPRSVAVAISTDGFNPYGPKYPGKNMNVYLEPLVDDLVRGWEGRGIRTYDASKKEYFDMYVWYHTSLHDLPARALFCGWCTHGKWPCPQCRQAVTFFWLNKGGKYSCFDEARQFLERRHAYRSDVKSFKKGRVVRGPKPIPKTGTEIKAELDALQPSPDGNGFLGYGETHQWTHKPCLWKLPYFEFLELPHNIDVMHTEKNISEAIWSTIVDTEKTKDNIKARIDQERWCDRPELNMQPPNGAKKTWTKPHAPFCLTKAQKREVFQWMKDSLFFPDGFAANWMRGLNIETLRVQGLKSHDYHIWLERIMPIEASIAEAVLNVEVANFTTKHYDPNIPTKHNPVLRLNAANNEEVPKLSIFVGLGGKSSGSKPYRTDLPERTLIHSYVLNTMVEVKPYIE